MIKVEFQYFLGCPNATEMLENVRSVIKILDLAIDYEEILVENLEEAVSRNFRGSPTLLVNDQDLKGLAEPEMPGLTCRIYRDGIPGPAEIKRFITNIA